MVLGGLMPNPSSSSSSEAKGEEKMLFVFVGSRDFADAAAAAYALSCGLKSWRPVEVVGGLLFAAVRRAAGVRIETPGVRGPLALAGEKRSERS